MHADRLVIRPCGLRAGQPDRTNLQLVALDAALRCARLDHCCGRWQDDRYIGDDRCEYDGCNDLQQLRLPTTTSLLGTTLRCALSTALLHLGKSVISDRIREPIRLFWMLRRLIGRRSVRTASLATSHTNFAAGSRQHGAVLVPKPANCTDFGKLAQPIRVALARRLWRVDNIAVTEGLYLAPQKLRSGSASARCLIRLSSLNGLLKKPIAPASRARVRVFCSG